MNRYYVKTYQGMYQVFDRALKIQICYCLYKEQAVLVAIALNNHEDNKQASVS